MRCDATDLDLPHALEELLQEVANLSPACSRGSCTAWQYHLLSWWHLLSKQRASSILIVVITETSRVREHVVLAACSISRQRLALPSCADISLHRLPTGTAMTGIRHLAEHCISVDARAEIDGMISRLL